LQIEADLGKPRPPAGPQGRVQILARLKVGETYNVSYTEHLAMVVEKTAKR